MKIWVGFEILFFLTDLLFLLPKASFRKELLVPVLCGIFFAESLSVMLQVGYFKYSRKKHGTGRRIFLMAPLHHHYQKKGYHESKIVMRFLIVGILLAVLSIVTLKIR